jgi:hypothetical protein
MLMNLYLHVLKVRVCHSDSAVVDLLRLLRASRAAEHALWNRNDKR